MSRLEAIIQGIASDLDAAKDELNRLDAVAGDGDLGITAATATRGLVAILPELEGLALGPLLRRCGTEVAKRAPSTAGTLGATGLIAAGRAIADQSFGDEAETLASALAAAVEAIAARGRARAGEKTMLDALLPAAAEARSAGERGATLNATLSAVAEAATRGAEATREMTAVHGRAGWLADRSSGHPDAGAWAVVAILRSIASRVDATAGK